MYQRQGKFTEQGFQLIAEQLKHKLEEMNVKVSNKDDEIAILNAELLKTQTDVLDNSEVRKLHRQNKELRVKNFELQEKEMKDNAESNARLTLIINLSPISLPHHSPLFFVLVSFLLCGKFQGSLHST